MQQHPHLDGHCCLRLQVHDPCAICTSTPEQWSSRVMRAPRQLSRAGLAASEATSVQASRSAAAAELASLLAAPRMSSQQSASRLCARPQPSTTLRSWYTL